MADTGGYGPMGPMPDFGIDWDDDELESRQQQPIRSDQVVGAQHTPSSENVIIGYSAGHAVLNGGGGNILIGRNVVGRIDELDDREGFSRPPNINRRYFFSRFVKERRPDWVPFRFLTPLRPQMIITDGADGDVNRYSGFIAYVWDYDSDTERVFRVNRQSAASLMNLGLDRENIQARRWLAQWEPAANTTGSREGWGTVIFRPILDTNPLGAGIIGFNEIANECLERLERFPVEVDRRRDQSTPPMRRNQGTPPIRRVRAEMPPDDNWPTGRTLTDDSDDPELAALLGSIKGETPPRVGPHFPMPGKTVQPPPGKIGGRKLDLD